MHTAVGFVESQALLLERQTAIGEQAADLGFGILHQIFMKDAVTRPGSTLS